MRNLIHILFCLVCLGNPRLLIGQTQPLTGTWLGKLYQQEAPPFGEYDLRIELKQEGTRVTGMSYISIKNRSELYAKMTLEGRWDKGIFTFHELEMVNSKHTEGWGWCLKTGKLTLKQDGQYYRLEGPWEGYVDDFPCKPGTLNVEKLNPQAKSNPQPTANHPPKADPQPTVPKEPTGNFGTLANRKITHQKEVPMLNEAFTVYVYDGDKVDGDIISLQYNGVWLLKKYPLSKTKKALRLEIVPGADNQLVLFAENVGEYPPNTAAITFFDGKQEKNLNLSSDLVTCGALKFVMVK